MQPAVHSWLFSNISVFNLPRKYVSVLTRVAMGSSILEELFNPVGFGQTKFTGVCIRV